MVYWEEKQNHTITKVAIFTLIVSAILIFSFYYLNSIVYESPTKVVNNCNNITGNLLISQCLVEEVQSWYKYNISNRDVYWDKLTNKPLEINWSFINESGGVCWHFAEWYKQRLTEIGEKNIKLVVLRTNDSESHEFTVFSNDEGWCSLDQNDFHCVRLGDPNE